MATADQQSLPRPTAGAGPRAPRRVPLPWLKPGIFLGGLVPLAWLAVRAGTNALSANPIAEIENELGLVALIFLGGNPSVAPMTLTVANLVGTYGENYPVLTAAAFISMTLPLIVFFSMQRYFVRGILAGSVKG